MPKDYRRGKSAQRYSAARSSSGSGIAWAAIGVMVGLALAILLYFQYQPAVEKKLTLLKPPTTAQSPSSTKPINKSTPEFDFYTLLPSSQETTVSTHLTSNEGKSSATASPPVSTTSAPAAMIQQPARAEMSANVIKPVSALPSSSNPNIVLPSRYFLQVMATKNYTEADRQKAELTMLGFDVSIQTHTVNNQVWHRISIGPYPSKASALQQQRRLQRSKIPSTLIAQ